MIKNKTMKTIKTGIIFLILSCSYLTTFGQAEIFGHWKASCYLERKLDGSLAICGLCPTKLEKNQVEINDFELEISNQMLKIIVDGKSTNITYSWDSKADAISFEYEKSKYTFNVLKGTSTNSYILKNNSPGGVLLLTKM